RAYSLNWLENIRDWCISRQIWWGHRIPVWTCQRCGEQIVQVETPTACPQCTSPALEQDPDVLDTWFSSALWPFAVLGWPERTPALEYFHPTDLLITGRDILYLWVARMIMTALEFVGEIPFYQVFVHPTILTRDGRRMSKTLGTGLDPLDLIDKYGTDATRFSLLYQCTSTQDIRFDAEVVANRVQHSPIAEMGRNFCNKVWNATRFVLLNLEADLPPVKEETLPPLTDLADRWVVSQLHRTIQTLTQALESYTFSEAARLIYEFVWGGFCDWYVEMAKARLEGEKEADRRTVQQVLVYVLERTLRLLHPLMPFLSEELWQQLPHEGESVMVAPWPTVEEARFDEEAEAQMELLQDTVRALRNICAEVGAKAGQEIEVIALTDSAPLRELLWQNRHYLARLLRYTPGVHLRDWHFLPRSAERPRQALSATVGEMDLYLPLAGLVDRERELARLQAELAKVESALERSRRKLENRDFLEKAPAEVVARERTRRQELQDLRTRLAERLSVLSE
ncbi:MAG TPA: valine--tRNA ligase, partial [Armatimonadetes bacterium]|nr:valine--tRNA ligase [Armatimonadota bacterium]